jgi:hypothetical protein
MTGALPIKDQLARRGIRHLCHATMLMNLPSIRAYGLISCERLNKAAIAYVPNDKRRYDGRLDLISCTIEVPNARYLWNVGGPQAEWVVFLIDAASELTRDSTHFCAGNAARLKGRSIESGPEAFASLFANTDTVVRGPEHHPACSTDLQAEVLVKHYVRPAHIMGLVVASAEVAKRHRKNLQDYSVQVGAPILECPDFFERDRLIEMIQLGQMPRPRPVDL